MAQINTLADLLLHQRPGSITVAGIGRTFIESLRRDLVTQTPGILCLKYSGDGCFARSGSQPEHFRGISSRLDRSQEQQVRLLGFCDLVKRSSLPIAL